MKLHSWLASYRRIHSRRHYQVRAQHGNHSSFWNIERVEPRLLLTTITADPNDYSNGTLISGAGKFTGVSVANSTSTTGEGNGVFSVISSTPGLPRVFGPNPSSTAWALPVQSLRFKFDQDVSEFTLEL